MNRPMTIEVASAIGIREFFEAATVARPIALAGPRIQECLPGEKGDRGPARNLLRPAAVGAGEHEK